MVSSEEPVWQDLSMNTDILKLTLVFLTILVHVSESKPTVCFGDPVECLKNNIGVIKQNRTEDIISSNYHGYETDYDEDENENDEIGVRSSYVTGRYCFASDGYSGTCQFSSKCRR